MRVLVTGAAGFIASRVVEMLANAEHQVIGFDELNDAYDIRVKRHRLSRLEQLQRFSLVVVDISDRRAVRRAWDGFGPFDAVINLAARAGVRQSIENPWVYISTNVVGTLNLLDLCKEHGIGKFVMASTSSLYGAHNPLPFSEEADTDRPLSPYAASKKGAEALCYSYHHLYGVDVTILRYFTVYGPAGRPDMSIFRFVKWVTEGQPLDIYGDGSQSRDFTYVDDIARGTIAALAVPGFEVINLGGDHPASLSEVISLVEKTVGRPASLRYNAPSQADVRATWANIDKARHLLGWEPRVSLEEGIQRAVEWYIANRDWARHIWVE